jgi:DNA-directed RNA polymerase subunit RPC12/RpoP
MLECLNNSNKYSCVKCNKIYKNRSGLWYHNDKIHPNILNTNGIQNVQNSIQNVYIETTNIVCKYCDKKLFNRQSRWRHEKIILKKNNFYLLKKKK